MSFFSSILEKLGFGGGAKPQAQPSRPVEQGALAESSPPVATPMAPATPGVAAIPVVDVVAKLDGLAAANPQKLDWKTSIVDLLKLLGLDSSFDTRKALAAELGCPADKMGDSAAMNLWLHKTVLQKLAANGGNVPKDLL